MRHVAINSSSTKLDNQSADADQVDTAYLSDSFRYKRITKVSESKSTSGIEIRNDEGNEEATTSRKQFSTQHPSHCTSLFAISMRSLQSYTYFEVETYRRCNDWKCFSLCALRPVSREFRVYELVGFAVYGYGMSHQNSSSTKLDNR